MWALVHLLYTIYFFIFLFSRIPPQKIWMNSGAGACIHAKFDWNGVMNTYHP